MSFLFRPTATSVTWVDNFNDQSLSEYSGDTSAYVFDTSSPIEGTATLDRTDTSGGYEQIVSTSGLDNYISKGTKFQCKIRSNAGSGASNPAQIAPVWGATDTSNFYHCRYGFDDDDLILATKVSGSYSNIASDTSAGTSYSAGDVLTMVITWDDGTLGGSDNDITVELMNDAKTTTYTTISGNNSDHSSSTGVGVDSYLDSSGLESQIDAYKIL